jgi:hypothetical protein
MFSNGGTFLLEELNREAHVPTEAYGLIQDRLQYIFYDSCPCYLHMPWKLGCFWKDAFPFPGWSQWGRHVYLIGASVSLSLWCLFTCSLSRSQDFWKAMQTPFDHGAASGTSSSSQHHELIYMYTTADKVTDATRIDELIETRGTVYSESGPPILKPISQGGGSKRSYRVEMAGDVKILDEGVSMITRSPSSSVASWKRSAWVTSYKLQASNTIRIRGLEERHQGRCSSLVMMSAGH